MILPVLVSAEDGKNGLVAKSGDAPGFARQLVRLIEDPSLRARLGDAAGRTVEERYTDVRIAKQSLEYWTRALGIRG